MKRQPRRFRVSDTMHKLCLEAEIAHKDELTPEDMTTLRVITNGWINSVDVTNPQLIAARAVLVKIGDFP